MARYKHLSSGIVPQVLGNRGADLVGDAGDTRKKWVIHGSKSAVRGPVGGVHKCERGTFAPIGPVYSEV